MTDAALPRAAPPPAPRDPASEPPAERIPAAIVEAAIAWALRLDYGTPTDADRGAFERWLQADPRHQAAWQRVHSFKGLQRELGGLPSRLARDVLQTAQTRRQGRGPDRRAAVKLLSLAGILLAGGWAAHEHTPWQRLLADASTGVGERKTLRLADGSVITLNTDSAVSIDLAGPRRLIVLRRGEILVTTGADAEAAVRRPFWVRTPFGRLEALGTRFVVRLDGERARARVSVQEGAVALHPAGGGAPAIAHAGESFWLAEGGTAPAEAQPFEADGWADGVIAGTDMRLQDLLAELSRYRPGRIACDPHVAGLRLSGVFQVEDTDRALQFLAQTQPVRVSYRTRFWVTVAPRDER